MTQAPAGWRLVPVELTPEMDAATSNVETATEAWHAMLAAALLPAAPAADRAGSEKRWPFAETSQSLTDRLDVALAYFGVDDLLGAARNVSIEQGVALAPPAGRAELAEELKNLVKGYAGEECLPWEMVEAAIDALARSTDAPSERQAWWRQKCPKCGASRMDIPGCQCEDDPGALLRQIRALADETKRVGHGVLVPVPELVAEEGHKFMRGELSLFDHLPIGDVAAATSMLETAALATPLAAATSAGCPCEPKGLDGLVCPCPKSGRLLCEREPASATSTPCASGEGLPLVSCEDSGKAAAATGSDPFAFLRGAEWYRAQALAATQAPAAGVVPAFAIGGMHASTICGTAVPATDAPREPKAATGEDLAIYKSIADNYDRATTAPAEAPDVTNEMIVAACKAGHWKITAESVKDVRAALTAALTQAASTGGKS
jgi:hypothetical protein